MSDLIRIGKVQKNKTTDIVFSITDYKEQKYVDIREHVNSDSYSGFTKKGVRFNSGLIDEWLSNLEKVRDVLEGKAEPPPQDED